MVCDCFPHRENCVRFFSIANRTDPRRCLGAAVCAKETVITSKAECMRPFVPNYKDKVVSGTVLYVVTDRSTGRASTSLRVDWTLSESDTPKKCVKTVKLCKTPRSSTKPVLDRNSESTSPETPVSEFPQRPPSDDTESEDFEISAISLFRRPDATAHGVEWYTHEVLTPIGGVICKRDWHIRTQSGDCLADGVGEKCFSPFDYFIAIFPRSNRLEMVEWKIERLLRIGRAGASDRDVLRFFGITVLMTRFEFGN